MRIAEEESPIAPTEVQLGHVYLNLKSGALYLGVHSSQLIRLSDGTGWAERNGFGGMAHKFVDVTDQYEVRKIGNE